MFPAPEQPSSRRRRRLLLFQCAPGEAKSLHARLRLAVPLRIPARRRSRSELHRKSCRRGRAGAEGAARPAALRRRRPSIYRSGMRRPVKIFLRQLRRPEALTAEQR
ncbi:hypothetical protein GQ55_3G179000 [Panicum hallii var. hallii]|uniref:Uncharacterized protein n=1 Tax=Panicum hallii var. hallii TaxID=1504633 RepID=A0A2T7EAM3_9POAL|nr:hypothetical protein GQ55_3G179000 [Panicum hallii var. hallii]